MLFARYNPLECAVAPQVAYSLFRMSARMQMGLVSIRVARVLCTDLIYGTAHVHECRKVAGS